jgi:hypothetical protein
MIRQVQFESVRYMHRLCRLHARFYCGIEAMSKDSGQISIRSPIHMTFGEKWRTSFRNHDSSYNFKLRGTVIVKYMTFFILYERYRIDKMCLFYGTFAGLFDFVVLPLLTACCRPIGSAVSRSQCIAEDAFTICISYFNCSWRQCFIDLQEWDITCLHRRGFEWKNAMLH